MSLDYILRSVLPDSQESLVDILMWARTMRTPTLKVAAWLHHRNIQAQHWFDLFQDHGDDDWLMARLHTHAPATECLHLALDTSIPRETAASFVRHLKVPGAVWRELLAQELPPAHRQQLLAWSPTSAVSGVQTPRPATLRDEPMETVAPARRGGRRRSGP